MGRRSQGANRDCTKVERVPKPGGVSKAARVGFTVEGLLFVDSQGKRSRKGLNLGKRKNGKLVICNRRRRTRKDDGASSRLQYMCWPLNRFCRFLKNAQTSRGDY